MTTTLGAGPVRELPRPPWRRQVVLLRRLFREPHAVLDEVRAEHGSVAGLGGGPLRVAIIGDPAVLRELFALPTASFRWGHRFNVLGFVVGRESMIVSDGADHRRRRSSVQGAFSRRRLDGWIPMILERTDAAIDEVVPAGGDPVQVDVLPWARSLVLEVVVRAFFGERLAPRAAEIGELFRRPQAYLESPGLSQLPHPFPGTARARVRADRRALDSLIDAELAVRRSEPVGDPTDVLEVLAHDGSLSAGEVRDQVVTLIGAGFDTTAATVAWMVLRTAAAPGLVERLRAEADEVLGAPGTPVPADPLVLRRLDLAGRVVRETTRLHPAGALSPRQAAEEVEVGGYRIPRGTMVLWSAHLAGRDPEAWADALTFDPDRFLDLSPEQRALADAAWVPFGRGPRACIGFALAQMELTLVIARMAQRLDVEPVRAEVAAPVGMVVNRPEGGAPVRLSRRA